MKKPISSMTPEEAVTEEVMLELAKLLRKARKAMQKADEALQTVYDTLADMCIDLEVESKAENADLLVDAISCYVQYGEFGCKNLMSEIREQYERRSE